LGYEAFAGKNWSGLSLITNTATGRFW